MRQIVTEKALRYTRVPEIYRKKIRVGFGIYLDLWRHNAPQPWSSDHPNDNYMTTARLEKAVRNALGISDGYVWVYSEIPSWWLMGPEDRFGEQVRSRDDHAWIDPAYQRAIERAIATASTRRPDPPATDLFKLDHVTATKLERANAAANNIAPTCMVAGMFDPGEANHIHDRDATSKAKYVPAALGPTHRGQRHGL